MPTFNSTHLSSLSPSITPPQAIPLTPHSPSTSTILEPGPDLSPPSDTSYLKAQDFSEHKRKLGLPLHSDIGAEEISAEGIGVISFDQLEREGLEQQQRKRSSSNNSSKQTTPRKRVKQAKTLPHKRFKLIEDRDVDYDESDNEHQALTESPSIQSLRLRPSNETLTSHSTNTTKSSTHSNKPMPKMRMPPSTNKYSLKSDFIKTALWILFASLIATLLYRIKGRDTSFEFITGYIVEYSLSIDNLFVFLLIFRYFKVPRENQERVLFLGILGAMVLRATMIICGEYLVQRFEWISIGFAVLLLYSSGKLLWGEDDDEENLEQNKIIRGVRRVLPVCQEYHGDRFYVWSHSGVSGSILNGHGHGHGDGSGGGMKFYVTPLMIVLITIELSDVVFAMDSVPAVLGLSKDPFVIYSSNILAVMGLRSLFFIVADAISELRFLKQSLACVLGFVGVKMIAAFLGYTVGVGMSLGVVIGVLAVGVGTSLAFPLANTGMERQSSFLTSNGAGHVSSFDRHGDRAEAV